MWHDNFRDMPGKEEKAAALGIPFESGTAHIRYYNREYKLCFTTGDIIPVNKSQNVPFFDAMFIYHLFWYSSSHPKAALEYIPFRDVPGTSVFDAAFKKSSAEPFANHFSGRLDSFCKACESLSGTKLPYGDAGYSIPIWGNLYLRIIFWDGDEEFPASVNVLFDKNIKSLPCLIR